MDLHVKRRPKTLDEVVGHKSVVSAIRKNVDAGRHAWAFVGPAGTGKTTLARIVAKNLGVEEDGLIEVNGASVTGIDPMRELLDSLAGYAMTSNGKKAVIIDECHRLSKQAFDAMLKPLEEPYEHVYFFLCSTDAKKIPAAIMTRCLVYTLKELAESDMAKLLASAVDEEALTIAPGVGEALLEYADGSPRRLLTGLQAVAGAPDVKAAREILVKPDGTKEAFDFAQMIVFNKGFDMPGLQAMGQQLLENGETTESLRYVTLRLARSMFLKSGDPRYFNVIKHFTKPSYLPDDIVEALYWAANIYYKKD
jgi:DNA polymerase III gamma/tau subunit